MKPFIIWGIIFFVLACAFEGAGKDFSALICAILYFVCMVCIGVIALVGTLYKPKNDSLEDRKN